MGEAWHQAQVRRNPRDTFRERLQAWVDSEAACGPSQQARFEAMEAARAASGTGAYSYDSQPPPAGHQVRVEVPTWKFDDIGVALSSPCRECLAAASTLVDKALKLERPE